MTLVTSFKTSHAGTLQKLTHHVAVASRDLLLWPSRRHFRGWYHVIIFQLTLSQKIVRSSLNFGLISKSKSVPETREQALHNAAEFWSFQVRWGDENRDGAKGFKFREINLNFV